ncbi:HNH endonuclease [Microbulbifer flavimaris]|uniref:HNH endonuclease n=1 Tax=Microbulbifer flavimaris TaxID=1781068 RepID=A0ABX4HZW9_9GAMM|nr:MULTISPECIES: HNH endonuclease [Microbulbifer]KUJ83517.1 HNH endonuclease [Microbulbifer sp. ZGT114]PCO05677.1 HNH endonuclease [Microbulbifer flavimaris]
MQVREARILRLNLAGQPLEWLNWQEAACLYVRELVTWSLGGVVQRVHGGINRLGERSTLDLAAIIACGGERMARPRRRPPLNNRALFFRDAHTCLYCGKDFILAELTRDHVQPVSRGGKDVWENVVTACRRCNQHKGNRLLQDIDMELLALPFCPNPAEYLALINSDRIRGDQMEFLRGQFANVRQEGWLV